jgi:hypothetical protein
MEIFISVLWICVDAKCEFMQSEVHFYQEEKCLQSLEQQKSHMRDLVKQAGRGKITVMEGICADAKIKVRVEKQTSGVEE